MRILLVDVGGTKTRVSVSTDGRRLADPIIYPTPRPFATGLVALIRTARRLTGGQELTRVIMGLPGLLNRQHNQLLAAGHLRSWEHQPLGAKLKQIFRAPVTLENDAALGGLGEARFGAGRGQDIVAYITIGTGVGGARIIRGRIDRRQEGFEPGHQLLLTERGRPRTLENLVSGSNIKRRFGQAPEKMRRVSAWKTLATELAFGLVNVVDFWSPEIIILGGGVMAGYMPYLPLIRRTINAHLQDRSQCPRVVRGRLGDRAGLWGALALAKSPN